MSGLAATLLAFEQELLDPAVRAGSKRLDELLADEFVEFGASGRVFDKAAVIALLGGSAGGELFELHGFRLLHAGADVALASYVCKVRDADGALIRTSNRSSTWRRRDGRWQLIFHQGTIST